MKLPWRKHFGTAYPSAPAPTKSLDFLVEADLLSDVGCVRTNNEDTGRIARASQSSSGIIRTLVIVADGMGGHNAGEVASAIAAETLEAAFAGMSGDPGTALRRAVIEANHRIYREAQECADRAGMGTTCTALLLQDGMAYAAHVGDSRIYLLRNGGIYLVTEDHSQVMEMVRAGLLTMEEARHHPDKNVITRALGRQAQVEVATWPQPLPLQADDGFLLCSDGVCEVLDDDEMNSITTAHSAADACEELIRLARSREAADNITVAIARVRPASAGDGGNGSKTVTTDHRSRPTRRVEMTL